MIVADACVLAKLFLNEPLSDMAEKLVRKTNLISFPKIALVEVAGAISRTYRKGLLSEAEAREKFGQWRRFAALDTVRLTANAELLPEAEELSLALKHPVADCLYLSLARRLDVMLATSDAPFITAALTLYPAVRHLAEFADS